jgi:hypothetical protein
MLQFNPKDPGDTPYKLLRAVKESGLSHQQTCDRMKSDYDLAITPNPLSRSISRGTLSLQRALQILAICGVSEVGIEADVTVTNE